MVDFPEQVSVSSELIEDEVPKSVDGASVRSVKITEEKAFHEKKLKNTKVNQGGSYLRKKKKYKNPKTRGEKPINKRKK